MMTDGLAQDRHQPFARLRQALVRQADGKLGWNLTELERAHNEVMLVPAGVVVFRVVHTWTRLAVWLAAEEKNPRAAGQLMVITARLAARLEELATTENAREVAQLREATRLLEENNAELTRTTLPLRPPQPMGVNPKSR